MAGELTVTEVPFIHYIIWALKLPLPMPLLVAEAAGIFAPEVVGVLIVPDLIAVALSHFSPDLLVFKLRDTDILLGEFFDCW